MVEFGIEPGAPNLPASGPEAERQDVRWRGVTPAKLLAIAVALFIAPAIYVLTASMLSQQGSIGGATLSGTAETVIWVAGSTLLLAPFAIRRFLRSSERSAQLLFILVITVAASVFGLVLSFTTGRLVPVWVLGVASMLGILSWSWAYRECFGSCPLEHVAPRYTAALVALGAISLVFATARVALWDHAATSSGGSASSGYMIFINTVVGISALATARLRKLGSTYARTATQVLSWALLPIFFLGTITSIYWISSVRKKEKLSPDAPAT
jgi:hypothetical protein